MRKVELTLKEKQDVNNKLEALINDLHTDTYVDKSVITMYQIGKSYIEKLHN